MVSKKTIEQIAHIENGFCEKFGIPRQSGLLDSVTSTIVFEPKYRDPNAIRGIEGYSHLWLIWEFSEAKPEKWSPTVRPPRLGGNKRVGVFASRSPFRPNSLGLSCVKLTKVTIDKEKGPVLTVQGADLMNGTPIFDIKPYLPFADSKTDAQGGFADEVKDYSLEVEIDSRFFGKFNSELLTELKAILSQDPRPSYIEDGNRVYTFDFAGYSVSFTVAENKAVLKNLEERSN